MIFARNYNDFESTSQTLNKLKRLSNDIKGRAFEALVQLLLVRSGFDILGTNISLGGLRSILGVNGPKIYKKEEFDIVASLSGVFYVFELKSISPTSQGMERTIKNFERQTSRQSVEMYNIGIREKVKFIGLTHFNIGIEDDDLPGVDNHIYLREGYDDIF